jgi:superfamily II RNA helicase
MIYKGLELDRFQEEAIDAIDQEHSVLVTAPTGAGKTVIAEYTVEKCIETGHRVIYTAPIKALSNQKYRDFYAQYGEHVGIVTGDVVLNPFAQVLLMTTEIFRNTIFDDIARLGDVEYVIFDEIHYINDIERGTVWEESIIFAPQHIKFVSLSATIPNINQFAEWMRSVREIELDVVEELQRPVPLKHHLYLDGYGLGTPEHVQQIQELLADIGRFEQDEFIDEIIAERLDGLVTTDLVDYIQEHNGLPCLYFCFSRKGCQQNAEFYAYNVRQNFLTEEQSEEIIDRFDSLCERYGIQDDRNVVAFRDLVKKGIAYHHAGMLPTLKEVVERLFTSGLLQLLFTTETFAVGINMPACTAVFESLEKYDGVGFRYLKTREYHQMAGRAGRRGIDPVGYVYARINPRFADVEQIRRIISDRIELIESQFNLAYSSILNLYEKYGEDIYDVCTRSLSNFQNYERLAEIDAQVKQAQETLKTLPAPTCIHDGVDATEQVGSYIQLQESVTEQMKVLRAERLAIKHKERGRKRKQARVQKFAHIDQQVRKVESVKNGNLCHGCHKFKTCNQEYRKIGKHVERIKTLEGQRDHYENFQKRQIASRLKVLEALGYIEGEALLPRGKIASQIYGYEMQITQLLFKGFFEGLSEDDINVLVMAIVSEPRKDSIFFRKLSDKRLRRLLETADAELDPVRALESDFGVAETTPTLDTKLGAATLAWSRGCEFEELHQYGELADGDFVRSFRLVIDMLRQMRRAMSEHTTLVAKLDLCIGKMNRDVVDAERQLRIGQDERPAESDEPEVDDGGSLNFGGFRGRGA